MSPDERKAFDENGPLLTRRQDRLSDLINTVLRDSGGTLRYYQGYHDVACVFLSSLGGKDDDGLGLASKVLHRVSLSHFSDAAKEDFTCLSAALKLILFPLLSALDVRVHSHIAKSQIEPFFALSWLITWFSHDIRDTGVTKRLFDAFMAAHPLFPLYLSVAMILHPVNRVEVLETECDFAEMHNKLSSLPKNSCGTGWVRREGGYVEGCQSTADEQSEAIGRHSSSRVPFQDLIDTAISYMRQIPPRRLPDLARRYRRGKLRPLLKLSPSIALFRPPPPWALASTIPSRLPPVKTPRSQLNDYPKDADRHVRYVLSRDNKNAIIASGVGGSYYFATADERNRKLIIAGAIGVAVLSVTYALYKGDGTLLSTRYSPQGGGNNDSYCPENDSNVQITHFTVEGVDDGKDGRTKGWVRTAFRTVKLLLSSDAEVIAL